ncbi:MAG: hypothetical protein Q8O92_01550 [Candidatus Latescibacter sp.]|nr:hypothetical protein [Candidatus Latescibacter sp.]
MKRIVFFLATALIITIAYGCSKDNVAPSFSVFEQTKRPVNLVASFFKNTVAKTDSIRLTWSMPDTTSVTNYLVSWSDSSVFDLGKVRDEYTNSLKTTYTLQTTKVLKSMGYTTVPDTLLHVVYFTVSALYNNKTLTDFIGPRAVVDSALVNWK